MKRTFTLALTVAAALLALFGAVADAQAPQGIVVVPESPQIQANVWVDKPAYQVGERIQIHYSVSVDAYVYIIDIDAAGRVTQIFPNVFSQNNFVRAGTHTLPDSSAYNFVVVPPAGTELVQIIATLQPVNLGPQGFAEAFPNLGNDPAQFQAQAEAAIQGIVPTGGVATAFTSFQVVGGQPSNRPPVARFGFSPTNPQVGQPVTFDATSSFDPDGVIVSYQWDLDGDGFVDATGSRVSRSYFAAGQVHVSLTVRDNQGATASTAQTIQIGRAQQPPVAGFGFTPTNPAVGQAVIFDAGSSFDPDGFILSYEWDFNGDGFTDASGVRVSKAFFSAGTFRVTLTVRDNDGLSASTSQTVQVGASGPTTAGFFIDAPSPFTLRIRVQGQPSWFFQNHAFRIVLETDGVFTSVNQQGTGNAAPQGIVPVPNRDTLELTGQVRDGSITYLIGLSQNTTKVKFDLRLDTDGDGDLERSRNFVFLGSSFVHPPSNPFVLSFGPSGLVFDVSLKVCLVLVDQPGIRFSICLRFGQL